MVAINAIRFTDCLTGAILQARYTGRLKLAHSKKEGPMLLRSHAAHAAPAHWLDDARSALRATWHPLARAASYAWRNAVTRRELADLDDRMLADIGVTRATVRAEMDRFPWEHSPHRRQPTRHNGPSLRQRASAMWQRHRSRQRIAELDADILKDIGVSFAEAEAEANKPFWRG
jgi:uncharacterized protein YjiS (DUF1127 family)